MRLIEIITKRNPQPPSDIIPSGLVDEYISQVPRSEQRLRKKNAQRARIIIGHVIGSLELLLYDRPSEQDLEILWYCTTRHISTGGQVEQYPQGLPPVVQLIAAIDGLARAIVDLDRKNPSGIPGDQIRFQLPQHFRKISLAKEGSQLRTISDLKGE